MNINRCHEYNNRCREYIIRNQILTYIIFVKTRRGNYLLLPTCSYGPGCEMPLGADKLGIISLLGVISRLMLKFFVGCLS